MQGHEFLYNYQQEDVRAIDYVVFEIKATAEDRQDIADEVNKLYREFQTTQDITTFVNSVSDSRYDSAFKKQSELQARIAAEQANIQNEQTKLQMYSMVAAAEDRIQKQRQREINAEVVDKRGYPTLQIVNPLTK